MNETEANSRIAWHMKLLRSIEEHAKTIDSKQIAPAGSGLAADDLKLSPFHTSHLVTFCLKIAEDAFQTARIVCDTENGNQIPFIGLYPLLRTAMESSALATWLLAPDPQPERIRRSLGARWSDVLHDDQAVSVSMPSTVADTKEQASSKQKALRRNTARVRAKKNELRKLAELSGVAIDERRGVPGFGPMLDEIAEDLGLPLGQVRGTWHFISGLTHPSFSGALGLSDFERLTTSVDGVFQSRMTAKSQTVAWAMDAALLMYQEALNLVEKRSGIVGISGPQPGQIHLPPDWEDAGE